MPAIDKVEIALREDLAKALRDSVDAGDYPSIDDAMQDAIRLWRDRRSGEAFVSIKTRVEQSQSDRRPSLSSREVDERLEALFAREERA